VFRETVARRNKHEICRPAPVPPFPYQVREQMQGTSMDITPKARRRKTRSDLVHLRTLPSTQPATKIGQVTWAWTEIEAGFSAGMKFKEVWEAAGRHGLTMSYVQFRVCISRLRRRRQKPAQSLPEQPPPQTSAENGSPAPPPSDPFRNLREQRERTKPSRFEYDPSSIDSGGAMGIPGDGYR
jgi:hypothetical protein